MKLKARGKPVSPPNPNIGRKAKAQSIGTVNLMDPPHKEIKRHVNNMTEGIDIITVVAWKKVETTLPIPVRYMWWAQTMNARKPRTITA